MRIRRLEAAPPLALAATLLAACAGGAGAPGNSARAIDIRLYDSDEQLLVIHNATPEPLDVLEGRGGRATTIGGGQTMEVRFRVVSLESHLRVADQAYYFHMAGPVTNRIEEMDGRKFIDSTPAATMIYYRDGYGSGEFPISLDDCAQTPGGQAWETKQWGPATHQVDLPSRVDGATQTICPRP